MLFYWLGTWEGRTIFPGREKVCCHQPEKQFYEPWYSPLTNVHLQSSPILWNNHPKSWYSDLQVSEQGPVIWAKLPKISNIFGVVSFSLNQLQYWYPCSLFLLIVPRDPNLSSFWNKWHSFGISFSHASHMLVKTSSRPCKCSLNVYIQIR